MQCERKDVRQVIDSMFLEGMAVRRWESVREHLYYCCDGCQAYFDNVVTLQHKMQRDPAPLSKGQLALIRAAVVAHCAPRKYGLWKRVSNGLLTLGAASVAAWIAVLLLPASLWTTQAPGEFRARGSVATGVGVRMLCVGAASSGKNWIRAAFPAGGGSVGSASAACKAGDMAQFTYTNEASDGKAMYEYLFLFGVGEDQQPLWYYPSPEEDRSLRIQTGRDAVNVPLPGSIRLSVNHRPGAVHVCGFFTERPLSIAEVEAGLGSTRGGSAEALCDLHSLGVDSGAEVSFQIHIEE